MSNFHPPLVLVHGLWDDHRVFKSLVKTLEEHNLQLLIPDLPHNLGRTSIKVLAADLKSQINTEFGMKENIDILGFSMGGLVARYWLQCLGGFIRTRRFISVGSPHQGTFTSQFVPQCLMEGIAEMKKGSDFLQDLNNNVTTLDDINCISFFCYWDLMVFPGWQAVLPVGSHSSINVLTHKELITNPRSLITLKKAVINC